jgi:hypothetical protein
MSVDSESVDTESVDTESVDTERSNTSLLPEPNKEGCLGEEQSWDIFLSCHRSIVNYPSQ